MIVGGLSSWLAIILAAMLSIIPAAGSRTLWFPLVVKPSDPPRLGIAGAATAQVKTLGGSWYHNWGPTPPLANGIEAVPMIWGRDVPQKVGGNSAYLMGMNEPDMAGQSNLTPEEGAQIWRKIEQLYPSKLLVSPVPSHEDPEWLVRFRDAYRAAYGRWPRLDGLAMHCYMPEEGGCIALGQKFVDWARAWGIGEIWVTEFAFLPKWAQNAETQAREFVAWMESEPMVKRYAPFTAYIEGGGWSWPHVDPAANPSLFVADGSTKLTAMGSWYKR